MVFNAVCERNMARLNIGWKHSLPTTRVLVRLQRVKIYPNVVESYAYSSRRVFSNHIFQAHLSFPFPHCRTLPKRKAGHTLLLLNGC